MASQESVPLKVEVIGRTKDGDYGARKEIELNDDTDNVFTIPKVITENGYINVSFQVDGTGVLAAIMVETWDPTAL